ncbi:copper amine oxidase N-terminal domain-containing protein [Caldalkalibacillus mannanilyticus]|uniref:copper amine oxidase N-terminal domain-containing protein n=1 Tax=Caldalkalibacillus mannanilyticus TaxID=1418 RepID=UPI000468B965|nr:copper amine oxidase N-terminal domain-containing protein [Caldalkalibacillus mannanilyticus]
MKKAILPLLIALISCLIITIPGVVHSTNKPILVVVDGAAIDIPFILEQGTTYVSLRSLVTTLDGTLDYRSAEQQIELRTKYKQKMVVDLKRNRILKEGLWREISILNRDGHTYYPLKQLVELFGKEVDWEPKSREVHIFQKVRLDPAQSIAKMISYHNLALEGDKVTYTHNDTVLSMYIEGKIKDITFLGEQKLDNMVEKKYAIFWQQPTKLAHLILTVRELPEGNVAVFTEGYTPGKASVELEVRTAEEKKYYWGNLFIHENRGYMRQLNEVVPSHSTFTKELRAGKSFDWFFFASREDLTFTQHAHLDVWNSSKTKHRSVWWLTPQGANRGVPEPYLQEWENGLFFYNLQASTPQLLMDMYKQNPHPLIKIALDNAAFTLMVQQGEDGFWRTEPNVAYLNRAFGLGENFIDTRMSADASIFLLDYYELYGSDKALEKAKNFTNYFKINDQEKQYYELGEGRFYPDYYSEIQHGKPLVSLNHVLHEVNYLLLLSDLMNISDYTHHTKLMLQGIEYSKENWITPEGDLYYALNNRGEYYAQDYVYITYRDLMVTKSLLLREKTYAPAIEQLLQTKHEYLQKGQWMHYETDLSFEKVYNTFDQISLSLGSLFLATPLQFEHNGNAHHYALGAFHWLTGATQLEWGIHTQDLDENQKYFMIDLKDQLVILNQAPKDLFLNETGQRVIVNGEQENQMIILDRAKRIINLEPNVVYSLE